MRISDLCRRGRIPSFTSGTHALVQIGWAVGGQSFMALDVPEPIEVLASFARRLFIPGRLDAAPDHRPRGVVLRFRVNFSRDTQVRVGGEVLASYPIITWVQSTPLYYSNARLWSRMTLAWDSAPGLCGLHA